MSEFSLILVLQKENKQNSNMTWQNPGQLFVAQELINKVKLQCCGIKVEEILLRNVLKCFGEEYHIVRSEDFIWQDDEGDGDDVYEIEFITNLPIEKFDEISSR